MTSEQGRLSFFLSALARANPAMTRSRIMAPLELGEDTQHLEHHPAARRGRIEPLLVQEQVDPVSVKVARSMTLQR